MRRPWTLALALLAGACQCNEAQVETAAEALRVDPPRLALSGFVGFAVEGALRVTNSGQARAQVTLSMEGPFEVDARELSVGPGEVAQVRVSGRALPAGRFEGTLALGRAGPRVAVTADVFVPPVCTEATDTCRPTTFDAEEGACLTRTRADGEACRAPCLEAGQCRGGVCRGTTATCDDGDACTDDVCRPEGCVQQPVTCPAAQGPCQVALCRAGEGCGVAPVEDGTPCGGEDACESGQAEVCIAGRCVWRPPPGGACPPRWYSPLRSARLGSGLAWDAVQQRVLAFGGTVSSNALDDTWSFDGRRWRQHWPASRPPPRSEHGLAADVWRSRVVLFGGAGSGRLLGDTWEWDGADWRRRTPLQSPSPRHLHAQAFDERRGVTVLFGGEVDTGAGAFALASDTWEWDGEAWRQLAPAVQPPPTAGAALVYSPDAGEVVLVRPTPAGLPSPLDNAWAWDGRRWRRLDDAPAADGRPLLGRLGDGSHVFLRVLARGAGGPQMETWWLEGARWRRGLVQPASPALERLGLAGWDARLGAAIITGANARPLRALPGTEVATAEGSVLHDEDAPSALQRPALAAAPGLGTLALFGGRQGNTPTADLFLWRADAGAWTRLAAHDGDWPEARSGAALAWDGTQLLLVAGVGLQDGGVVTLGDSWRWDGRSWAEVPRGDGGASPPPTASPALAHDERRGEVVLYTGTQTWLWRGGTWRQARPAVEPRPRDGAALAYHRGLEKVVLFGGFTRVNGQGQYPADTWVWDGTTWTEVPTSSRPSGRLSHGLAYDERRDAVVLYGREPPELSDTWAFDGTSWQQLLPDARPSSGPAELAVEPSTGRVAAFTEGGLWLLR